MFECVAELLRERMIALIKYHKIKASPGKDHNHWVVQS